IKVIEVPGTRQFANKVDKYPICSDLTLGQSDFNVASYVQDAMIQAIQEVRLKCTLNKGLLEFRTAFPEYTAESFRVTYDHETGIFVTHGASSGLDDILRS
ncbi:N-acetyl-L,L-diaminopimelate aminotransferase, partial [Staphylococcus pseudintermedius]